MKKPEQQPFHEAVQPAETPGPFTVDGRRLPAARFHLSGYSNRRARRAAKAKGLVKR